METQDLIQYLSNLTDTALLIKSHAIAALTFYNWVKQNLTQKSIREFTKQHRLDLRKLQDRQKLALRIASYVQANPITKEQTPASENQPQENNTASPTDEPASPSELIQTALTIGQSQNEEIAAIVSSKAKSMLESLIKHHFRASLESQLTQVFHDTLTAHVSKSKLIAAKLLNESKALLLAAT
ncbi:hypothetical protein [Gloeothece verrucosa]|uniref:Uncharacterized protein n=1 Tax=Gloeothece verrucosa (strain PCC 7822) TaxID=497965 RepID=E0UKH1_GLOV7|nr:hypothetical protein [Gloeothece verrucosa]ADN17052.1 hypothetical protein Cyan7822_5169 [Gloeothece verrucosa PCC 7822]